MFGKTNGNSLIDHCEYYYDITIGNGCLKCENGHHGIVVDHIFQCDKYATENTC